MKILNTRDNTPYRLKAMRVDGVDFGALHGVEYLPGEIRQRWAFLGPYSVKSIDECSFEIATRAGRPLVREVWERSG